MTHTPARRGPTGPIEDVPYIDITENVDSPFKEQLRKHFTKHWLKWVLGTILLIAVIVLITFWRSFFPSDSSSEKVKEKTEEKTENTEPTKKGGKSIQPDFTWGVGNHAITLAPGESASIGIEQGVKGQTNITGPVTICDFAGNSCTDEVPEVFNDPTVVRLTKDKLPYLATNNGTTDLIISFSGHRPVVTSE